MIQNEILNATLRAHDCLARSEQLRHAVGGQAERLRQMALKHQESLQAQLPALAQAVESAMHDPKISDDERAEGQRAYLTCVQNIHRCEQVYQQARRQHVVSGGVGYTREGHSGQETASPPRPEPAGTADTDDGDDGDDGDAPVATIPDDDSPRAMIADEPGLSKSLFDGAPDVSGRTTKLKGKHRVGGHGAGHQGSHWETDGVAIPVKQSAPTPKPAPQRIAPQPIAPTPVLQTPGASVRYGVAGMREAFEIGAGGAKVTGYLSGQDFPQQSTKADRGEVFYVEVPESLRKHGTGYSLVCDALKIIQANGSKTVNIAGTTAGGRGVIAKLLRDGKISGPIQTSDTGKAEYQISAATPPARAAEPPPSQEHNILHRFPNVEDGTEAYVARNHQGKFVVGLRDTDADQVFPMLHVFPDEARAVAEAKKIANVQESPAPTSLVPDVPIEKPGAFHYKPEPSPLKDWSKPKEPLAGSEKVQSKRVQGSPGVTFGATRKGNNVHIAGFVSGKKASDEYDFQAHEWPKHPYDQLQFVRQLYHVFDREDDGGPEQADRHADAIVKVINQVMPHA